MYTMRKEVKFNGLVVCLPKNLYKCLIETIILGQWNELKKLRNFAVKS